MTAYGIFNLVLFGIVALALWCWVHTPRDFIVVLRTAATITLLAFPWDYFAIASGAWAHSDPGPVLFGVPLHDLAMCFACTLFSASLLNHSFNGNAGRKPEPEGERGAKQHGDR